MSDLFEVKKNPDLIDKSVIEDIKAEIEQHRRKTQSIDNYDLVGDCLDIIDRHIKEYEVKIITRGNCMICGKELTEGLFFCKECEDKQMTKEERAKNRLEEFKILHQEQHGWDTSTREEFDVAIKALETVEEFEKAQIITGSRLNGRTYAYKRGLADGKRKALEQEPVLDKIRAEIERERSFQRAIDEYDVATGLRKALEIIDKYKAESEEKENDKKRTRYY